MNNRILLAAFLLLCACENDKEPEVDPHTVGERFAISGTVLVQPAYASADEMKTFASQKVFIRIDTGSNKAPSNYFYSTTTNGSGQFTFYVSDTRLPYAVFTLGAYTSSPAFAPVYYGAAVMPMPYQPAAQLQVVAKVDTLTQSGLILTTQDASGKRMGRASVAFYTSELVAYADRDTLSGAGSVLMTTTDSMGKAFITRLPTEALYMNARLIAGKDTFRTIGVPVRVPKRTIVSDTLRLE
ncbi:hypothetical protein ACWKWU_10595 [Chitinophaga lutea]